MDETLDRLDSLRIMVLAVREDMQFIISSKGKRQLVLDGYFL